jgi:hypothetical protein
MICASPVSSRWGWCIAILWCDVVRKFDRNGCEGTKETSKYAAAVLWKNEKLFVFFLVCPEIFPQIFLFCYLQNCPFFYYCTHHFSLEYYDVLSKIVQPNFQPIAISRRVQFYCVALVWPTTPMQIVDNIRLPPTLFVVQVAKNTEDPMDHSTIRLIMLTI